MRKTIFCFDLDETLVPIVYKYHQAGWRCGMIICKALGFRSIRPLEVVELHTKVDGEMVESHGLGVDRPPAAWIRTYRMLAEKAGVPFDPAVAKRVGNAAARFKYGPYVTFDGVEDVLRTVRARRCETHLVTAGDPKLQWRKIRQIGIQPLFDSIHVTDMEKVHVMAEIVGSRANEAVMVGDSKRTDVVPAKKLGMTAVWIPSQMPLFADADATPDFTIGSIRDLPSILDEIDKK